MLLTLTAIAGIAGIALGIGPDLIAAYRARRTR
jgi:hypothetical protein